MGNLGPPGALGHPGVGPPDLSQAHIQQQISQPTNMGQQANMGPPMMQMDMTNIDPNINYMASAQQSQGMQMQGTGSAYGYKSEDV